MSTFMTTTVIGIILANKPTGGRLNPGIMSAPQ